ncbi:MAG: purine-nucleoside phosphorylase, partial [Bacteroidota bacterium]
MSPLRQHIDDAIKFLRTNTSASPAIGIILGTGLGGLAKEINADVVIDYGDIPHFPLSTVESHHGKLIFGTLGGKSVVAMQGRFHYYEGYT